MVYFYWYLYFKRIKKITFYSIFLFFIIFSPSQEIDSLNTNQLEELNFIYSQNKELISSFPLQILNKEDIQRLNSLSIADAIKYFSGVQLKDYGGIGGLKTINVRSLGSSHTAVFYDGIKISNAQNGQVDLGKFSLENIEEIELFSGQKSSIFLPARAFFSANSLYLKTKNSNFEQNKNYQAKINFKTGSFGLVNPSFFWSQKINKNISFSSSFEYLNANGKYKYRYTNKVFDTILTRQNGDIQAFKFENTFFGKLKKASWNFKTYFYTSERGLPGAIVANKFEFSQRQKDENFFLQGSFEKTFSEKYKIIINAKFSQDFTRYLDPEFITLNGILDNKYHLKEYYISLVQQYSIKKWWNFSLATDYSIESLNANLYQFPYPTRNTFQSVFSTAIHFKKFDFQASLLQASFQDKVKMFDKTENRSELFPIFSMNFQPFAFNDFRIRVLYKESFRMPSFNDLYYTLIGNVNLNPEIAKQYNLGFTWIVTNLKSVNLSIQSDVYYNLITNKIIAMPSANLFRWTMTNLGKVEIKGLETNIKSRIFINKNIIWNFGLGITFQKSIDITDKSEDYYKNQIPYTPEFNSSVNTSLEWKKWQFNYSFIYTGERFSQKANIPINYIKPFYTSDLALIYNAKIFNKNLKISTEINNILNQYYDVILNFPMPGINFRTGINYEF